MWEREWMNEWKRALVARVCVYAGEGDRERDRERLCISEERSSGKERERERNKNVWRGSKVGWGEADSERIKSNELRSEWECLCSPARLHILSQKAAIDSGKWTIRGEASGSRVGPGLGRRFWWAETKISREMSYMNMQTSKTTYQINCPPPEKLDGLVRRLIFSFGRFNHR